MKDLSSPFTFFYKYIFLLIWIFGYGLGTRKVLLAGSEDPRWIQYIGTWLIIAVIIYFVTGTVKKVTLNNGSILVSNFIRSEEIQLSAIESVDGSTFLSPRLVWFNLKSPSAFGSKIVFIPVFRKTGGIGKHPLVQELIEELDLSADIS